MARFNKIVYVLIVGAVVSSLFIMAGCKKAVAGSAVAGGTVQSTSAKLDEARASVESAEKTLAGLRAERMRLEAELQAKKSAVKQ